MITCHVCSESKNEAEFFRTDVTHPRCKSCCAFTKFCAVCCTPKHVNHFKGKGDRCVDCKNGVRFEQDTPPGDSPDYIAQKMSQFEEKIRSHGITPAGCFVPP